MVLAELPRELVVQSSGAVSALFGWGIAGVLAWHVMGKFAFGLATEYGMEEICLERKVVCAKRGRKHGMGEALSKGMHWGGVA